MVALVDVGDAELVGARRWFSHHSNRRAYYAATKIGGKWTYMHRLILGESPLEVDHINGDKLDNRRSNLRFVDRLTNVRNRPPSSKKLTPASSRHVGVWRRPSGRWSAQVTVNYKTIILGTFDTEEQALAARQRGVAVHYGIQP